MGGEMGGRADSLEPAIGATVGENRLNPLQKMESIRTIFGRGDRERRPAGRSGVGSGERIGNAGL